MRAGGLWPVPFLSEKVKVLSASAGELRDLRDFAELHQFGGDFLLLEKGDGLGLPGIGAWGAFAVTLGADAGENPGGLDALGKTPQNGEVILARAFDDFDIDH